MALGELISSLYDLTEALMRVRQRLSEILGNAGGTTDEPLITFAVKEIDIVRISLLYEYELLDTGNVVLDAYVSSYYARRVEILRMTGEQVRGHKQELEQIRKTIFHDEARKLIAQGTEIVHTACELLDSVIENIEQRILRDRDSQTTH